ncbi:MAG TPA: hypothetical protein VMV04_02475 [Thermodesulfobacteriota bacterium]|nr:hypothetical protein [Thermodesulfobacteriota bacterium]
MRSGRGKVVRETMKKDKGQGDKNMKLKGTSPLRADCAAFRGCRRIARRRPL